MSNKNQKKLTMPLNQFLNYIEEQEKEKKRATRATSRPTRSNTRPSGGSGGRLSDRLKARRGNTQDNGDRRDRRTRRHEVQTAARVVSKKTSTPKLDIKSDNMFPSLNDSEVSSIITGCWGQGIQPIIIAKDLPDPVMLERQKRQEAYLEYKRRLKEERERPFYSDEEYSDEYYTDEEQQHRDVEYVDDEHPQEPEDEPGEWDEVL